MSNSYRKYTCSNLILCNNDFTPQQRSQTVKRNGSNNQYKPQNMRYAEYIRTQPGFSTFANKKYVNPDYPNSPINLQTTVAAKQLCFRNVWCKL
jgi:hypothetical protein